MLVSWKLGRTARGGWWSRGSRLCVLLVSILFGLGFGFDAKDATISAVAAHAQSSDQDRALKARQEGIMPYGRIVRMIEDKYGGQVVNQRLEERRKAPNWIYRLTMRMPDGKIKRVEVDATSGRVLRESG
ncbi:MAG: hypothetical protein AAGF15_02250 [Pseudomonadota bacterium]